MPRASLNPDEISRIKEKILDTAAQIINQEGFLSLSMRKIGARAGMTAANLYNYYANKDEINIAIRLRAGRILYEDLARGYDEGRDLPEKIRRMMTAYLSYGLTRPHYYAIMFDMPTPKYANYVGTPLEALAREEKASSEQSVALLFRCARELRDEKFPVPDDPDLFMTMIWAQLHGLVSLYSNNALAEIVEDPQALVETAARNAFGIFFGRPPEC